MPAFFAAHVVLLGTWVPDGVLLVLSVVALTVTKPGNAAVRMETEEDPVGHRA